MRLDELKGWVGAFKLFNLESCSTSTELQWSDTGGLKAVAQIEDAAVGLGMTTFMSPIKPITKTQKVM